MNTIDKVWVVLTYDKCSNVILWNFKETKNKSISQLQLSRKSIEHLLCLVWSICQYTSSLQTHTAHQKLKEQHMPYSYKPIHWYLYNKIWMGFPSSCNTICSRKCAWNHQKMLPELICIHFFSWKAKPTTHTGVTHCPLWKLVFISGLVTTTPSDEEQLVLEQSVRDIVLHWIKQHLMFLQFHESTVQTSSRYCVLYNTPQQHISFRIVMICCTMGRAIPCSFEPNKCIIAEWSSIIFHYVQFQWHTHFWRGSGNNRQHEVKQNVKNQW